MPPIDPEHAKRAIGRRVAELRADRGWTQQELAEVIADVSPQYVGLVEQGRQNLTVETLVKVANALNVTLRALLDPPTSMKPRGRGRPRKV